MFTDNELKYLDLLLIYRDVEGDFSDEEESSLYQQMDHAYETLSGDEEAVVSTMAHDLNILENFDNVSNWKSPRPSTLAKAVRCFEKGELKEALEHARHIHGSEDRLLRQGLILVAYEDLFKCSERYDKFTAMSGSVKYQTHARHCFLSYAGNSC